MQLFMITTMRFNVVQTPEMGTYLWSAQNVHESVLSQTLESLRILFQFILPRFKYMIIMFASL